MLRLQMRSMWLLVGIAAVLGCAQPRYDSDAGIDSGSLDGGSDAGFTDGGDAGGADQGEDVGSLLDMGSDAGCDVVCYVDDDNDDVAAAGANSIVACGCGANLTARVPTTDADIDCDDTSMAVGPATGGDPARCGTCTNVCSGLNGTPTCVNSACSMNCDNGYGLVGLECVAIAAPTLTAPMSTATTTSRRPTFHWTLAPSTDGGRLQVCANRGCTTVLVDLAVSGSSARPVAELAPGVYFWRVYGRLGVRAGTAASPVWQVTVPGRSAPTIDSSSGQSADFNGDGYADIAVGASQVESAAGRVHVYYGSSTGPGPSPDRTLESPAGPGGQFGVRVTAVGDVDGDGYADLAVAANGAAGGLGRVYVYLGSAAGVPTAPSSTLLPPTLGTRSFSTGLAGGDINGDGYSDVVVGGTPTTSSNGGWLHVFYGTATGLPDRPSQTVSGPIDVYFGYFLDVGDFDGDGRADVLASAWPANGTGQAFAYPGTPTGLATTASATMNNPDGMGLFGQGGLIAVGDLNGDGRGDAAVGDYNSSTGRIHVYYGGGAGLPSAPSFSLDSPGGCCFGSALSVGAKNADVNGDGYIDLVAGNPVYPASGADRQGRAYVFLGGPSVSTAPETNLPNPDGTNANYGTSVVSGDVDGDGYSDLIVGSYLSDAGGRVHIYRGGGTGIIPSSGWVLNSPDGPGSTFAGAIATSWLDRLLREPYGG